MLRFNRRRRYAPTAAAADLIDPASLAATGYWVDYDGGTWEATASAGTSGSHTLINGASDWPTVGANFGAHPSANFNAGATTYLWSNDALSDLVSVSAYTIDVIAEFDVASAAGSVWNEPYIFGDRIDGDFLFLTYTDAGVRAGHRDAGGIKLTTAIALATGVKACIQVKYDGTDIKCRVSGSAWQSIAADDISNDLTGKVAKIGSDYSGTGKLDGRIARIMTFDTAQTDGDLDSLLAEARANFAVA
jgi:hypothetical protein